eukprot:TRINITY_DN4667_c0_g2_i1.p1 TRINITY_DN4667_c0_g2~~TRINITY_DN4667_c0_g2_i1.p1  ORF type:complete len:654 (+),score=192.09 TRINITY_DN4667_c0_g2_i1:91-1962(+)
MADQVVRFGLDFPEPQQGETAVSLDAAMRRMRDQECDFLCLPLLSGARFPSFAASAQILQITKWCNHVVGKLSSDADCDALDPEVREQSEETLRRELAYAAHSTLPSVLLQLPAACDSLPNTARVLLTFLLSSSYVTVWVLVPLMMADDDAFSDCAETEGDSGEDAGWRTWNGLRGLCQAHSRLGVVLQLTEDLPRGDILRRWCAEPVKALMVDTSLFVASHEHEYCYELPAAHQEFVLRMHRHGVQIILQGEPHPQLAAQGQDSRYYRNSLMNVCQRLRLTDQERYEAPYRDYLQDPLQPLMDNLDSKTYEVFEKDPVKYERYEEAVFRALSDMRQQGSIAEGAKAVVTVVGAGRGPLVRSSLKAAKRAGVAASVYAVEKNPYACVTLRSIARQLEWGDSVQVVEADMRSWEAPELCDVLVSELLGSFGDNELSPECIDGAQRVIKPSGVSVPSSYRSYVAPLQTHKLHNELSAHHDITHLETPYVVRIHGAHLIAGAHRAFEFRHPKPPAPYPQRNDRMIRLRWTAVESAVCHGFAGYFDAVLYKDVEISIHPKHFSPGMFSWFPMYFPLRVPVHLRRGEIIESVFWRVVGKADVWYEWCVCRPMQTAIHNPGGRSYKVGL